MYVIRENWKVWRQGIIVDIFSSSLFSYINKSDHTDSIASLYQVEKRERQEWSVFVSITPIVCLTNSLRLNTKSTWPDFPRAVIFPTAFLGERRWWQRQVQWHDIWYTFQNALIAQGHMAQPSISADCTKDCTSLAPCQNSLSFEKDYKCRNLQLLLPLNLPQRVPLTERLAEDFIS